MEPRSRCMPSRRPESRRVRPRKAFGRREDARAAMPLGSRIRVQAAAAALGLSCLIGAIAALATAVDVGGFILKIRPPSKISDPLQIPKLFVIMCALCAVAALLGVMTRQAWRTASAQRNLLGQWSPGMVLIWAVLCGFLLLVYYPLPSHKHHLDKLLLLIGAVLVWSMWFLAFPQSFAGMLNSRVYAWLKVGLINLLIFVIVAEVALRLTDPLLGRSGLFGHNDTPASLKPYIEVAGSIRHSNSQGFRDRERAFEKAPH